MITKIKKIKMKKIQKKKLKLLKIIKLLLWMMLLLIIICFLQIMAWDTNAIVKKHNAINIIANALEKEDIALIVIALDAVIKSQKIVPVTNIKQKKKIKIKKQYQ